MRLVVVFQGLKIARIGYWSRMPVKSFSQIFSESLIAAEWIFDKLSVGKDKYTEQL